MIDYSEFSQRAAIHSGRAILFVRHSERLALEPDDPTFGFNLGLTERGCSLAEACGKVLRAAGDVAGWSFWASRLKRTRLTAQLVASAIGVAEPRVRVSCAASIPGLWETDQKEAHAHYEAEGAYQFNNRLMLEAQVPGYRPMAESTRMADEWLRQFDFGTRLVFICSHDAFIASYLRGLGVYNFTSEHWIGFLQGAALFLNADGTRDVELCVPDKDNWHNSFMQ